LSHQVGDKDWVHVPVYHRELVVKKVNYGYSYTQRYHNLFGLPTIVRVPRNTSTYVTVYQAVLARCSRYVCSSEEAQRRLAEGEREKEDEEKEAMEDREDKEGEEPMEEEENNNSKSENGEEEENVSKLSFCLLFKIYFISMQSQPPFLLPPSPLLTDQRRRRQPL
jgi:hypothetical protein